jgi:SAM-dependent methyltransferase
MTRTEPTPDPSYAAQDRGDGESYRRYLDGMDASMRQKVALTAAHLLARGKVADMGMGSGTGSQALAALYPGLHVTGVDVNPETVRLARERYQLPNLAFVVGDIAAKVFDDGALDAVLDSSVLHHVTSFNGYDWAAAGRALSVQARTLSLGGVLVVRDFVAPEPGEVVLTLHTDDGDDSDDPASCSSARLLERFAREFRSLAATPGFELRTLSDAGGRRRYGLSHRLAVEFLLRKDYRADWDVEVKEEYTYFTQREFERTFAELGLRVLASTPLYNPWIVKNRFQGRYSLATPSGTPLDHPPSNYVIVGERVAPGEGVRIERLASSQPLGFLELISFRQRHGGQLRDLVRRPHATVDVLPWFEENGEILVLARGSYPRPIAAALEPGAGTIDGSRAPQYVIEPLNVLQQDKPLGETVEEALRLDANIEPSEIESCKAAGSYYPSPGGILEEVRALHVRVAPTHLEAPLESRSGFSTSGRVRALEACQLLRAAQVGALPDARLELNVYGLLHRLGRPAGPWIGEAIDLPDEGGAAWGHDALPEAVPRRAFSRSDHTAGFLDVECASFHEYDARGREVAVQRLEYVRPRALSCNTVAVALLRRRGGRVELGIDDDDLPAAQCFSGNSNLWVTPAWRLPHDVTGITPARQWLKERVGAEYGAAIGECWELGGPYRPSAGLTPETVFPLAVSVAEEQPAVRALRWVALDALLHAVDELRDGHLRVVVWRSAHALGLL